MPASLSAIVFKTPHFRATKYFFRKVLRLQIREASAQHFVIYSKSIRVVFIASASHFEVEFYLAGSAARTNAQTPRHINRSEDPNGIAIIIIDQPNGK